jgi:TetR/AcrR family transcriptional regulator, cholesterol catabolism regulator
MSMELTQIVEKTSEMYKRYGIKSVTMDDTAHKLGISKKTLYQFVKDKNDLVERIIEYENSQRAFELDKIHYDTKDITDKFVRLFHLFIKAIKDFNPAIEYDLSKYYPKLYQRARDEWREMVSKSFSIVLAEGKAKGIFRKSIDESLFARMFLFGLEQLQNNNIITTEEFNSSEFTDKILDYHICAISTEKGLKLFKEYKQK